MNDRAEQLSRTARARHDATVAKADAALRLLANSREPVTFGGVARRAGVSRSWIYRQPELRREIERLRTTSPVRSTTPVNRASDESNRQRIVLYREELARLKAENAVLREQLARKLGAERAAALINSP